MDTQPFTHVPFTLDSQAKVRLFNNFFKIAN